MHHKIILGTAQLGLSYGINNKIGKLPIEKSIELLKYAYRKGITTLDTAYAYGNALEIISLYHQQNSLFHVINKFSENENNLYEKIESTLKELCLSSFDVFLFHSFHDFHTNTQAHEKLARLKKDKKINKIGVSIYTNQELQEVINTKTIDVIQLPFNLLDNWSQRGILIEKAKEKNKEIHVRSVFLQGLFFMNPVELPSKLIPLQPYLEKINLISSTFKKTILELALNYVLHHDLIDKVLIGVDTIEQLNANLDSIDLQWNQNIIDEINKIHVKEINLLNPTNWK